jgi:hypothetical protein
LSGSGPGSRQPERHRSVFINCPFDPDFEERLHAIVFAITACGFEPRSALEREHPKEQRIKRIERLLLASKYSIHDLSRCTGEGDRQLARLNMPLELGMAMGLRMGSQSLTNEHDWHVLVLEKYRYSGFISDLDGFDLGVYDGSVPQIIREVIQWLRTRPDAIPEPTVRRVVDAFADFQTEKQFREADELGRLSWIQILRLAKAKVTKMP